MENGDQHSSGSHEVEFDTEEDYDDKAEVDGEPKRMPRGGTKQLTMKYNMNTLRKFNELDVYAREQLSGIFGCEADDVPIEIDFMEIFQVPTDEERRQLLINALVEAQAKRDISSLVDYLLNELRNLSQK